MESAEATDRNAKAIAPLPLDKVFVSNRPEGEAWNRWVRKAVLLNSTVATGTAITGNVFFPRENKKHNSVIVFLLIGGVVFEFEMTP